MLPCCVSGGAPALFFPIPAVSAWPAAPPPRGKVYRQPYGHLDRIFADPIGVFLMKQQSSRRYRRRANNLRPEWNRSRKPSSQRNLAGFQGNPHRTGALEGRTARSGLRRNRTSGPGAIRKRGFFNRPRMAQSPWGPLAHRGGADDPVLDCRVPQDPSRTGTTADGYPPKGFCPGSFSQRRFRRQDRGGSRAC